MSIAFRTDMQPIDSWTPLRYAKSIYGLQVIEMLLEGAEVQDGGKWALLCEHGDDVGTGIVQDTNRRRLWSWAGHSVDWCCHCQQVRDTQ